MKKLIALSALSILGCSGGSDDSGSTYGVLDPTYSYTVTDQIGDSGLVLKSSPNGYSYVPFSEMESIYVDVEVCVADTRTPGPTVEFVSFDHRGLAGSWGVYLASDQLAFINTDEDFVPRNRHSDRATLRHEFVHHILYLNGQEYGHGNGAFERCGAEGTRVCNGVPCP